MTANNNSNRPDIRAYIGATGSGKGVSIREHLAKEKPKRLAIWDPLGEYGEFVTATTGKLQDLARAMSGKAFAVAYWPGADATLYKDKFAMFCRMVYAAGNCTVMVEELADVTSPSYAPPYWRQCTKKGRHRGLRLIAASQRPADVDKHFLGGCTFIRCFTLTGKNDRLVMADMMDVPLETIKALSTVEAGKVTTIRFMDRDKRVNKTTPGTIVKRHK